VEEPPPALELTDPPLACGDGGARNAVPLYAFPTLRVIHHLLKSVPVRTSALRRLGGPTSIFAMEAMIETSPHSSIQDPVAYRLALLSDARAGRD